MTLPVFETPRLILKFITEHDAEGLHEAYGDADAMRHWDLPPSRDVSQTAERIRMSAETDPRWHGMWAILTPCGPVRGRDQLSRAQRTATATCARVDRGALVLAPGPHDGGGAARDLAPLHAPERASDRSADRAGEPVVTAAGCEARLHRGGPAPRLALRRGRAPPRRDAQPAAHGMALSSPQLTDD